MSVHYTVTVRDGTGFEVGSFETELTSAQITETFEEYGEEMLRSGIEGSMSLAEAVLLHVGVDYCPFDCGHCHA